MGGWMASSIHRGRGRVDKVLLQVQIPSRFLSGAKLTLVKAAV